MAAEPADLPARSGTASQRGARLSLLYGSAVVQRDYRPLAGESPLVSAGSVSTRVQTLGRPRSVVWFTRRRSLASALGRRDAGNHAQRSRDRLGLVHHGRGAVLAALHFPAQLLRTRSSARPTFMDAADHLRFRAWPDGRRARSDRTWGRTVDLRALDRGEPSVDGCPERVTRDIPGKRSARKRAVRIRPARCRRRGTWQGAG